jgi:hypothetical protein
VVTASANSGSNEEFTNLAGLLTQDFSYAINDAYAMVEVISPGPVYDRMEQRLMAAKGYIAYPFKRYACFDGGMGEGHVRFQVNSQSVDRIYACSVDYTPTRGVVSSETTVAVGDAEVGTVAQLYSTRALRSRVRTGGGLGNTDGGEYYFTLAGMQLPAFHPCLADWYSITKCNLPKPHPRAVVVPGTFASYRLWHSNAFLICMRLCAPNSDLKHISGLDTRNMALDGMLTGFDDHFPGMGLGVWVESTAELRVMPGREVQLVP